MKRSIYIAADMEGKLPFYKKENFLLTYIVNWIIKREKPFKIPGMMGESIYLTPEQNDLPG